VLEEQMHSGHEQCCRGGVSGEDKVQAVGQQVRPAITLRRGRRQQGQQVFAGPLRPFPQRYVEPAEQLGRRRVAALDVRVIALTGDGLPENLGRLG
jgi:hypothetical protein